MSHDAAALEQVVSDLIVEAKGIARRFDEGTDFLGELEFNSIETLGLIVALERRFDIRFEPDDDLATHLSSFGALIRVLSARLANAPNVTR